MKEHKRVNPGRRFSRLSVVRYVGKVKGLHSYLMRCDCGKRTVADLTRLSLGRVKSCGCQKTRSLGASRKDSDLNSTYRSYRSMKNRCLNPKADKFPFYGGRGIDICQRWRRSFAAFLEDLGPRPEGTTLDRIDPDEGYFPANCRWADKATQIKNRRPRDPKLAKQVKTRLERRKRRIARRLERQKKARAIE